MHNNHLTFPGVRNPFTRLLVRAKGGAIVGEASVFKTAEEYEDRLCQQRG